MKTNNLLLLSILLLAGFFVSCKKDEHPNTGLSTIFDYRNKYTDDYNFTVTIKAGTSMTPMFMLTHQTLPEE